jgi:hypothetical protein
MLQAGIKLFGRVPRCASTSSLAARTQRPRGWRGRNANTRINDERSGCAHNHRVAVDFDDLWVVFG